MYLSLIINQNFLNRPFIEKCLELLRRYFYAIKNDDDLHLIENSFQCKQWAKSPKMQSVLSRSETHSFRLFFGDFAHWDRKKLYT